MNVLIVQQLAWGLRIGHEVARVLHGQGHRLSALVFGQEVKAFLDRQRDVPYEHVAFVDPVYDAGDTHVSPDQVREIEERYGLPSIWRVIYADRLLIYSFMNSRHFVARKPVSNEYALSVCWRTYRLLQELLDRAKPDYVLAPVIGSLANYLLYLECRHRNMPFFTIGATRFGKNLYIADDLYLGSRRIRERFQELEVNPEVSSQYDRARVVYATIRNGGATPAYVWKSRRLEWSLRGVLGAAAEMGLLPIRLARTLCRPSRVMAIRNIWLPSNSRWNSVRGLVVNVRERFLPSDAQRGCLRRLNEVQFPYVYFPLHYEPELSLLVFAPEHANQIEVCRQVALGLPLGVRLLVKEHPSMVASRRRGFYADLRGLVNVEVIHSSVSSHDLFISERCRGVLVISSSVGFEAAMNSRAVVLLGPVEYRDLPAVYRAGSLQAAIDRLRALCRGTVPREVADTERQNLAFLCALLENSFSFDYFERWNSGTGRLDARALLAAVEQRLDEGLNQ